MSLANRRTNRISVVGAVEDPGTYELPVAGSDLLSALVAAGGLADNADRTIEIRLPPPAVPTGFPVPGPNQREPVQVAHTSYNQGMTQQVAMENRPRSLRLDLVAATTTPEQRRLSTWRWCHRHGSRKATPLCACDRVGEKTEPIRITSRAGRARPGRTCDGPGPQVFFGGSSLRPFVKSPASPSQLLSKCLFAMRRRLPSIISSSQMETS